MWLIKFFSRNKSKEQCPSCSSKKIIPSKLLEGYYSCKNCGTDWKI